MPKHFSIDDYFAEARNREEAPLLHTEQLPALFAQREAAQQQKKKQKFPRGARFVPALGFSVAAALLAIVLLWPGATAPTEQTAPIVTEHNAPSDGSQNHPQPSVVEIPVATGLPEAERQQEIAMAGQTRELPTGGVVMSASSSSMVTRTIAAYDAVQVLSLVATTTNTLRLHPMVMATTAIVGPALITLTKEQLSLLGVLVENGKALYRDVAAPHLERIAQRLRISVAQLTSLIQQQNIDLDAQRAPIRVVIRTNGIGSVEQESTPESSEQNNTAVKRGITPRIVSIYNKGVLTATYWQKQDDNFVQKLRSNSNNLAQVHADTSVNRLVPIHFQLKDAHNTWFKEADVVLWYDASSELAEVLPSPHRERLLEELSPKNNEPALSGKQYFDTWRTTAGAIIATELYPNPVTESKAILRYTLREQRITTIALHDIFGRKLALIQSGTRSTGDYEVEIPLQNMPNGMYLVVITTGNNEQAVQRLLLQR